MRNLTPIILNVFPYLMNFLVCGNLPQQAWISTPLPNCSPCGFPPHPVHVLTPTLLDPSTYTPSPSLAVTSVVGCPTFSLAWMLLTPCASPSIRPALGHTHSARTPGCHLGPLWLHDPHSTDTCLLGIWTFCSLRKEKERKGRGRGALQSIS